MNRPAGKHAVTFEKVNKTFETAVAVDNVDPTIADGEFFAMLGPSGSGKTTCLRMIAGFEIPTSGRILLHGDDVSGLPPYDRDVNTVFQDYALFPHMTVADNVGYSLMVRLVIRRDHRYDLHGRTAADSSHLDLLLVGAAAAATGDQCRGSAGGGADVLADHPQPAVRQPR